MNTRAPHPDPASRELFSQLQDLALDLSWSWNHATDDIWRELDAALWSLTRNPWAVLQTVSRLRLVSLARDTGFRQRLDTLLGHSRRQPGSPAWFQRAWPGAAPGAIAYFSMEYMLSEALPLYSGGLGNVAGDQLKAASDLGVPLVGVGLLYQEGYFRQVLDPDGTQHAFYPYNDPTQLPIRPVRGHDGEWLRFELALPAQTLWLRAWQARVGRVHLYLLDSNDPANDPAQRGYTGGLYGGGSNLRIAQEIILGIGGWQLLERLGLEVTVCHLNEGHAAFTALARARSFMRKHGTDFAAALAVTRAGNVFTTHTPVAAGFDRYEPSLLLRHLGEYANVELGLDEDRFLALGRTDPANRDEPFGMAFLALRAAGAVNGVSRLHGEVSRGVFQPLFPRWPCREVPVGHGTNGVHAPSWDSSAADRVWTTHCGRERWRGTLDTVASDIMRATDAELWRMRGEARAALVAYARERLARQLRTGTSSRAEIDDAREVLEPDVLTIGFARRFVDYKRPNLLLHDTARLLRLLADRGRPVQLIIAGKAHPADEGGQRMVTEWVRFVRGCPEVRARAVFLGDHDVLLAEYLVQGVDVWLNTPRRPWEACGTSGMKVLVNGGLNVSVADGWWAEGFAPELGWSLGEGGDDAADAEALYGLLEREVIPCFYERDAEGLPRAWLGKVRCSMALAPAFSANRSVREYTERYYLPAAAAYRERAGAPGGAGSDIADWQARLARHWDKIHFGRLEIGTERDSHRFSLQVYLDGLEPDDVAVELYSDSDEHAPFTMRRGARLDGSFNGHPYEATIPARFPPGHYAPRVVPRRAGVAVPLEAPQILWYEPPADG